MTALSVAGGCQYYLEGVSCLDPEILKISTSCFSNTPVSTCHCLQYRASGDDKTPQTTDTIFLLSVQKINKSDSKRKPAYISTLSAGKVADVSVGETRFFDTS